MCRRRMNGCWTNIWSSLSDAQYTRLAVHLLGWICGILNPRYVALGAQLPRTALAAISEGLSALLPKNMLAELLYSADHQHDYHSGMAYLTPQKCSTKYTL